MNLLNEKLQKYYRKKLADANNKLKSHQRRNKQLETDLKESNNELKLEIDRQNDLIGIWKNNIAKINERLEKV